jgi:hypothetical protein
MSFSPEQGSFQDKYVPDYYEKNYRRYPKEKDGTSFKLKNDQALDPIERYNMLKYFKEQNPYKGRKSSFSSTKNRPSKGRPYGSGDLIYGNVKKGSDGPVYRNERKKKRVNYKTLLPQPKTFKTIDNRDRNYDLNKDKSDIHNEKNELKENTSYGYVKDHHDNIYFQVSCSY